MKPSTVASLCMQFMARFGFVIWIYNFKIFAKNIVLAHFLDIIIVILWFLIFYNMIRALEALYLGYLYSIVFWLRTLACIGASATDLWFLIVLMDFRGYIDDKVFYGIAAAIWIIWVGLAAYILIKYRPCKIKKLEITKIKLAAAMFFMGFKGIATLAISVIWRYLMYSEIYSVLQREEYTKVNLNIMYNFWIFLVGLFIYNIISSIIYLVSLCSVSARLLMFGHFSSRYSKGYTIIVIGELINSILGLPIAHRAFTWMSGEDYVVYIGSIVGLQGFIHILTIMGWMIFYVDGMAKWLNIGTD